MDSPSCCASVLFLPFPLVAAASCCWGRKREGAAAAAVREEKLYTARVQGPRDEIEEEQFLEEA